MRRTAARLLTGIALTVTVAGAVTGVASPVYGSTGGGGGLEVYPKTVTPGAQVTVNTTACGTGGTAAGDASAVGAGAFVLAPGTHQEVAVGQFRVPPGAQPGTYEIVARCDREGGGSQVSGDLVVTLTSTREPVRPPVHPRGSVKTGVGGALGPDPVQTAGGVAALAVAAAGGTWLLHRRARGDRI
ncbi:hypothetical protein PV396_15090 [Streptomyces sp. ME02-8801-2C]|uniref:hypothetical protein n=1 Tax=Streptomyces sp. ME02-8801-2C TaxID=3028680 RepID=UPI0029B91B72|nr:hypothetical protein [Streptomyces sp. ME02-8801-2C]MDX3453263.1 hypothetical protein [Streptomyces sp. ME02-8801-2C]